MSDGRNRARVVADDHPRVETIFLSHRSSPCTVRITCASLGRRIEDDVYVVIVNPDFSVTVPRQHASLLDASRR